MGVVGIVASRDGGLELDIRQTITVPIPSAK